MTLDIYLLCRDSEHQKNPFQSKQLKHFHQRNRFPSGPGIAVKLKERKKRKRRHCRGEGKGQTLKTQDKGKD